MLFFSRPKIFFILLAVIAGLLFALPNVLNSDTRSNLPGWMQNTINLGLDLQGGAHLLLEVDVDSVIEQQLGNELNAIQQTFRENGRIRTQRLEIDEAAGTIRGQVRNEEDYATALELVRGLSAPVGQGGQIGSGARTTRVTDEGGGAFTVEITDENIEAIRERTIAQSIEVLRRRIDPSGTTEMTLAREGDERILVQVPGAQNIDEIKERINTSANMAFHLVRPETDDSQMMEMAAQGNLRATWAYFEGDPASSRPSQPVIVDAQTTITGECLQNASQGLHPEKNTPIVNFTFNTRCAIEFGNLTRNNVGRRFAVILDDTVITAPNINGPIPGGSGFIEGGFTMQTARDLSLLLNAGALPAKLKIVEERSVGASLGDDSISAGKFASVLGMIGVVAFMWLSYGLRFGTIANIALTTNIVLIAGALSLLGSTLTLPGIAGIILTIGMAVDANVLIFERIREEAENGRPPINAIQTGYERSLAPILDANITTLIAAVTLYFVGSGPVRGFAVTLAIGIIMSVFTAVVFARLLTATWLRRTRPKTLPI